MEKNITAENKYYCFRTGPAPLDLTPYIAWTNPIADAKNIFYGDDLMVLFNTAGMKALYNYKAPKFIIYTQNGKALGKGELTLNEQLLHISGTDLIKAGIKPRKRYFVRIQDPYSNCLPIHSNLPPPNINLSAP
ncbi:hypothetical protein Nhal_0291 [Nitrosococcus halophilus Nc 4]|uniref:Uncharacterized protein n=1 Tax=Nitrosococcus halophilus (strain Nc4) TaxID=472759 RepID=D5BUU0_NITHN|nr:hypothetical protein Nhal_0291 [Nitrosococcus halophilus Nc 4]